MGCKYELIIWDVDGTLLDTSGGILASAKYAIEKSGFKVFSDDVLRSFIGPPLQKSFIKAFNVTEEKAMEMANVFRQRYLEGDLLNAVPYEGMFSLTKDICNGGIRQGVATYKRQDLAEKLLSYFGFSHHMDMIYGSDFEGKLTKKDIIQKVIKDSGVMELDKIVMIGDSDGDQKGAEQAGIKFIAVTYGFGFKEALKDANLKYAANASEIKTLLGI